MADNQREQQRIALEQIVLQVQAITARLNELDALLESKKPNEVPSIVDTNPFASRVAKAMTKARNR